MRSEEFPTELYSLIGWPGVGQLWPSMIALVAEQTILLDAVCALRPERKQPYWIKFPSDLKRIFSIFASKEMKTILYALETKAFSHDSKSEICHSLFC